MSFWITIAMQASQASGTFDLADVQRPSGSRTLSANPRCEGSAVGEEVVVCGHGRDRYRLPLPNEREQSTERVAGEVPGGMAALTPATPCGMFAGERRCSKREAARYGYGGGRDPITVLTKLARKAADPDAD